MKKRNPLAVFFLGIITLGIYDVYWLVKTKSVLNEKTKFHIPTIWLLVLPVILLIIAYIGLVGSAGHNNLSYNTSSYNYGYTTTTTMANNKLAHPAEFFSFVAAVIVMWIVLFVVSIIWFFKFSKAINEYTKGKMSTAVAFLILWVIHLIGVALVQDAFNDMS